MFDCKEEFCNQNNFLQKPHVSFGERGEIVLEEIFATLAFSIRPGGPKCLKYQNVPKLRPFDLLGSLGGGLDKRVYFISVPNNHTVI